jgi:hypothetical protein
MRILTTVLINLASHRCNCYNKRSQWHDITARAGVQGWDGGTVGLVLKLQVNHGISLVSLVRLYGSIKTCL